ncbi:MAG TPA: AzlD domain-containing protein [Euzebyales bacterium]|nr:AzlD domain-containing protein [Euzebyales bacterium]
MTWMLLLAITAVTVASRVLPMALLPTPRGRVADVLDALPAPLFASLAALALLGDGARPSPAVLLAAAAALLGASRRSLGLTLVCGIAGFLAGQALTA